MIDGEIAGGLMREDAVGLLPDILVRFEDLGPAGYQRVTVVVPLYWFVVDRQVS